MVQTSTTRRWIRPVASTSWASNGSAGSIARSALLERLLVEGCLECCVEQLVLVGEDPEDRALGDARRAGDLLRRDRLPVLGEQRAHGLDDRRPPLLGRER